MEVIIDNKDLEKLFLTGKSSKLRLPPQVAEKFFMTIQKIEAAESIHDLAADRGLHFEKLQGFENRYSMRLNRQYRLEMTIAWQNETLTVGEFYLLTISNHYQ